MTTKNLKVGDVFQIPLPEGRSAYDRVYKDATVGVYRHVTGEPGKPPIGSRDFGFHVGLYKDILENGKWPIVGFDGFDESESEWPPPNFVKDVISGDYQIYHKGGFRDAEPWEVVGLEEAAVWDAHHVLERIMKEIES